MVMKIIPLAVILDRLNVAYIKLCIEMLYALPR
jgi:hypothetical protein